MCKQQKPKGSLDALGCEDWSWWHSTTCSHAAWRLYKQKQRKVKRMHLDVKTGPGGVHAHVAMLHGKGCIDVLGQQGRVNDIPREGCPSIADVEMHRGPLRTICCCWDALLLVHRAGAGVPVGVTKPAAFATVTICNCWNRQGPPVNL